MITQYVNNGSSKKYNFSDDNLVLSLIGLERSKSQAEINRAIKHAKKRLIGKEQTLKQAFEQYTFDALKIEKQYPNNRPEKLSEVSMLYENADKIWDDFAHENQQKGRQEGRQEGEHLGRTKLAYEMLMKAYKQQHPTETIQQLKARLDRMTSEQLLKSLDQIIENALLTEETID